MRSCCDAWLPISSWLQLLPLHGVRLRRCQRPDMFLTRCSRWPSYRQVLITTWQSERRRSLPVAVRVYQNCLLVQRAIERALVGLTWLEAKRPIPKTIKSLPRHALDHKPGLFMSTLGTPPKKTRMGAWTQRNTPWGALHGQRGVISDNIWGRCKSQSVDYLCFFLPSISTAAGILSLAPASFSIISPFSIYFLLFFLSLSTC